MGVKDVNGGRATRGVLPTTASLIDRVHASLTTALWASEGAWVSCYPSLCALPGTMDITEARPVLASIIL
ncbi:hypothetical protein Hamer_G018824 [Homarus americanus]|uniref:Uncharacterized protein n=1 Tax=Homarus americanus TaxID=6706 RepID=A0A8J5MN88_HOMAM|nr:hypothetical protein Hamer_G018824 [Homarus americanus]